MKPTTLFALIRGINVGKAKRVSMAELRALVESLGYGNVRTLLNSGNVIFTGTDAADAASRIETALAKTLGVSARITVLTAKELAEIVAKNPLLDVADNPSRLLVAVFNDAKDKTKLTPLVDQDWSPDVLALGKRAAYLWCAGGILESKLTVAAFKAYGDSATTRNWATILKLHAMIE